VSDLPYTVLPRHGLRSIGARGFRQLGWPLRRRLESPPLTTLAGTRWVRGHPEKRRILQRGYSAVKLAYSAQSVPSWRDPRRNRSWRCPCPRPRTADGTRRRYRGPVESERQGA